MTDNRRKPQGPACRFWGTDGGCKKGSSCTYAHSWEGLEKTNRCFACSGMGHSKRDCPVKKSTTVSPWKQPAPKVSKVKKPGDEKVPTEGQAAGGEVIGLRRGGVPGGYGVEPWCRFKDSRRAGQTGLWRVGRSLRFADRSGRPAEVFEVYPGAADQICCGREGSRKE